MLCCGDAWFHLKLTTLKPRVNQYISSSYGNVVLSYVNVPQTLSSSWFAKQPKLLTQILFPNLCKLFVGILPFYKIQANRFMARDELSGAF